jgi:hypothetical protein
MGVLEIGGQLDLGKKPFRADHGRQLGPKHLYRHLPPMAEVLRQVHRRHPAGTHLAFHLITVGKRTPEPLEELWHSSALVVGDAAK